MNKRLIALIKNSYRKLKSYAYFDKTQVFLKKRIIDFESSQEKVGYKFEETANLLLSGTESIKLENLLSQIECKFLPKKVIENNINIGHIMSNKPLTDKVIIDDYQCFFDAPIEIHLLSMLWTMTIGSLIDRDFDSDIFGNRIREGFQEESEAAGPSPYLMKPYYEQYETWRDKSLDIIYEEHKKNNSTIMINLDLKRFYYQVDFNENLIDIVIEKESMTLDFDGKNYSKKLNTFIFDIMKDYSKKIKEFDSSISSQCLLPLGYMPSMILSNLYLKDFDESIRNSKPLYYGRYVDDILIVYRTTKSLEIEDDFKNYNNNSNFNDSCEKKSIHKFTEIILNKLYCIHQKDTISIWKYCEYEKESVIEFETKKTKKLIFNPDKVKIYYFANEYPKHMIEEFKKHIWETKSEFRLLPEDILEFDFGKMSKHSENNGIKITNIFTTKIDKFELSKFISKHLQIVKNLDISSENVTLDSLDDILSESLLIEMHILWESIFTLLVMSKSRENLELIILRILKGINKIEFSKKRLDRILNSKCKQNLLLHLQMSLAGAFSVVARSNFDNIFDDKVLNENKRIIGFLNTYSKKFRTTNFTNKSYLNIVPKFLIEIPFDSNCNEEIELFRLENIIDYVDNESSKSISNKENNEEYYLYPYNISLLDIQVIKLIKRIQADDWTCEKSHNRDILNSIWMPMNGYGDDNFPKRKSIFTDKVLFNDTGNYLENENNTHIKNNNNKIQAAFNYQYDTKTNVACINKRTIKYNEAIRYDRPCIGIGNVRIEEPSTYYDRIRLGKVDKSIERFKNLSDTINTVIKFRSKKGIKTNLFVLPEAYVPFEWISLLVNISKKNDLAIIAGLEHIKYKIKDTWKYYNFIISIFPVKLDKFIIVNVNFHLKVHYSPDEIKYLSGNVVCGNTYEMHKWRGMNIVPYCCYELTSINDRALFKNDQVNIIAAVVNNKDVEYFSNIVESVSRDLSAFVVQANDTNFGDSRIFQPVKGFNKNVLRFSGGLNYTALIARIELQEFKTHLTRDLLIQHDDEKWKARVPK